MSGPATPEAKLKKDLRVVDQVISMQATLRSTANLLSVGLTLLVTAASVIGIAFAFTSNSDVVRVLGVEKSRTEWLGLLAVVTFLVSISDLAYPRRSAANRRHQAVGELFALKRELGDALQQAPSQSRIDDLHSRYIETMTRMPPIPDPLFNILKARHLRKIEISKMLSAHPGMSSFRARRLVVKTARHIH